MQDADRGELVIIRRRSAVDAEIPKGGVWKIAFADFMTALMAFFLVMWLINATNEETRTGVANYFNPIKLADASSPRKGLRDPEKPEADKTPEPKPGAEQAGSAADGQVEASASASLDANRRYTEDALFRDPYAVLAEIAGGAGNQKPSQDAGSGVGLNGSGGPGAAGGEAYRDPFDPIAWKAAPEEFVDEPQKQQKPAAEKAPSSGKPAADKAPASGARDGSASGAPSPGGERVDTSSSAKTEKEKESDAIAHPKPAHSSSQQKLKSDSSPFGEKTPSKSAISEATQVMNEIGRLLKDEIASKKFPDLDVRGTNEGVLISLIDEADFGMFSVGSAEPRPEMITIMEKIAYVLQSRAGAIVIRGHTDGRPFKSENYDNWRLSTARAHMAYYMLVRGGLDEERVERIEGYADRELKVKSDPEAAQNRRIDILLIEDQS